MIQAIFKINGKKIDDLYQETLVVENSVLVDLFGVRDRFKDLKTIDDSLLFGQSLFLTISYLQDLHRNKKLFHGDIKPSNIFYEGENSYISSDSGSLVPLYDD
jgi:serine/threonine protein kinase